MSELMREALRKAVQLAAIASDWNLDEVEIDGQMVGIYDLKAEFEKALEQAEPRGEVVALKGAGRITGDGWKDTTQVGQVVFVWNAELPEPYASGQFPRIGNPIWSASRDQYDFEPASPEELRQFVEARIKSAAPPAPSVPDDVPDDVAKDAARFRWLRDHYHGFEHFRKATINGSQITTLDREVDEQIAAAPAPERKS